MAPSFIGFGPGALAFLDGIAANNDRDWFRDHAAEYEREVRAPFVALVSDLANEFADRGLPLRASPKHGMFRLHRDVRFSHDKRPYKISAGAVSSRDGTRSLCKSVSAAPRSTVSCVPATARMAARIGPMQGVQPKAKASPIT